jgi:hypothetical protein
VQLGGIEQQHRGITGIHRPRNLGAAQDVALGDQCRHHAARVVTRAGDEENKGKQRGQVHLLRAE